MFENIINWKLLSGSHEFPGSDGGTCVNEAAIVAAGFKYKKVSSVSDCPPCFSRPIAAYALSLNDAMPDDLRQELLLPFVTRLAGTTDRHHIEAKRAEFIVIETVNKILPIVLNAYGSTRSHLAALRCEKVSDKSMVRNALIEAENYIPAVASLLEDALQTGFANLAASRAADATAVAALYTPRPKRDIYVTAASILDKAIKMGKNLDIGYEIAAERLNKERQKVTV